MKNKYIIKFFSTIEHKYVYYVGTIFRDVPSDDWLNYTRNINKAVVFTDYKEVVKIKDILKIKFNKKEMVVEDISEYTKYNRFEIMDI